VNAFNCGAINSYGNNAITDTSNVVSLTRVALQQATRRRERNDRPRPARPGWLGVMAAIGAKAEF